MAKPYPNLSRLFYRDYYRSFDKDGIPDADHIEAQNQILFSASIKLHEADNHFAIDEDAFQSFDLKTAYPGLLTGSGMMHQTGVDQEIKLGFYFDHSSGLPCIPGSSVKGCLRHYLNQFRKAAKSDPEGVREYLSQVPEIDLPPAEDLKKWLENLIETVFEGPDHPYKRDVFLDAYPISSSNSHSVFLGTDYITPHPDPLKNPKPVQFLKILPQVTIRFPFSLIPMQQMTVPAKLGLFERLLADWGIGAKTGTGYGRMEQKIRTRPVPPAKDPAADRPPVAVSLPGMKALKAGDRLSARVLKHTDGLLSLELAVREQNQIELRSAEAEDLTPGTEVTLRVAAPLSRGQHYRFILESPSEAP